MISWRKGYGKARLYLVEAMATEGPIYIMEGELDCLLARQMGLNAVTNTAGASSWKTKWNQYFRGRDVVVCYDGDEAGRKGAANVSSRLLK